MLSALPQSPPIPHVTLRGLEPEMILFKTAALMRHLMPHVRSS